MDSQATSEEQILINNPPPAFPDDYFNPENAVEVPEGYILEPGLPDGLIPIVEEDLGNSGNEEYHDEIEVLEEVIGGIDYMAEDEEEVEEEIEKIREGDEVYLDYIEGEDAKKGEEEEAEEEEEKEVEGFNFYQPGQTYTYGEGRNFNNYSFGKYQTGLNMNYASPLPNYNTTPYGGVYGGGYGGGYSGGYGGGYNGGYGGGYGNYQGYNPPQNYPNLSLETNLNPAKGHIDNYKNTYTNKNNTNFKNYPTKDLYKNKPYEPYKPYLEKKIENPERRDSTNYTRKLEKTQNYKNEKNKTYQKGPLNYIRKLGKYGNKIFGNKQKTEYKNIAITKADDKNDYSSYNKKKYQGIFSDNPKPSNNLLGGLNPQWRPKPNKIEPYKPPKKIDFGAPGYKPYKPPNKDYQPTKFNFKFGIDGNSYIPGYKPTIVNPDQPYEFSRPDSILEVDENDIGFTSFIPKRPNSCSGTVSFVVKSNRFDQIRQRYNSSKKFTDAEFPPQLRSIAGLMKILT